MLYTYPTDLSYLSLVGYRLEGFKKVNNVYNARCPFCGDSSDKKKQRFYIYTKKGNFNATCKNCGYGKSFYNFMKDLDSVLFETYKKDVVLDNFKTTKTQAVYTNEEKKVETKVIEPTKIICKRMTELSKDNKGLVYLKNRGFSNTELQHLFYTDDFKSVAAQINAESSKNLSENEPRIVIPFYTVDNKIKAIQGRSLNPKSKLRYITIKVDDQNDKIYGIERIDFDKTVYAVEGPLDSLFVDNCVAVADGNLRSCSFADVLIYDNQPRNAEIVMFMEKSIKEGRSVLIWPTSPQKKKDINDLILSGVSKELLHSIIKMRTFKGINAMLELSKWKRI